MTTATSSASGTKDAGSFEPAGICELAAQLWERMRDLGDLSVRMAHAGYLKLYTMPRSTLPYDVVLIDEATEGYHAQDVGSHHRSPAELTYSRLCSLMRPRTSTWPSRVWEECSDIGGIASTIGKATKAHRRSLQEYVERAPLVVQYVDTIQARRRSA